MQNSITKISLKDRFKSLEELSVFLKKWRKDNPKTFRLDGHFAIGPANPAQWIYFEIQDFRSEDYSGKEGTSFVDGKAWNGVYFLTASTRGNSIDYFIDSLGKSKSASNIFDLTYTRGKEGIATKRKILLKSAPEEINSGWFCKQYLVKSNLWGSK